MDVIISALFAWTVAQVAKIVIEYIRVKKLNLALLVASGGMPSSHSAFVTAATIKIALLEGLYSPLFGAAVIFSFVVMYDAVNVRQSVGIQAKALNNLFHQLSVVDGINCNTIKEVCGHSLLQVVIGFLIGVISGFAV